MKTNLRCSPAHYCSPALYRALLLPLIAVAAIGCAAPRIVLAADQPTIDVWPGMAPGEKGNLGEEKIEVKPGPPPITLVSNISKPTLTLFRPAKEQDTGATVMICPGGGYHVLAWDLEGEEVARWLNSIGVTAAMLKYRVPARNGLPGHVPPLQDAQRGISVLRSEAAELAIDPKRIGILGFSAGGNLSARLCTGYDKRTYDAVDEVDKVSCRPDFAILIYPAWLVEKGKDVLIPELKIDSQTPPTFLVHAGNDESKVDSSLFYYLALQRAGVAADLHVYADGGHGFGLRPTQHPCCTWPQRCEEWLKSTGWLKAK